MSNVRVFNTITGQVGVISERLFNHPVFNPGHLVLAKPGQKSYVPELYKPRNPEPVEKEEED